MIRARDPMGVLRVIPVMLLHSVLWGMVHVRCWSHRAAADSVFTRIITWPCWWAWKPSFSSSLERMGTPSVSWRSATSTLCL